MVEQVDSGKVPNPKAARSAKEGKQGERTEPAVIDHIAEQLFQRPSLRSAPLYREMLADDIWRPLLPNERAFRGHVARARERLDRGRWSPVDASDEEARLVLPVLGRLQRDGYISTQYSISPRTAKWIARLRRWVPDLKGAGDYLIPAIKYADRVERGARTDDLDAILARQAARAWDSPKEATE
jgi:hypothetical protein